MLPGTGIHALTHTAQALLMSHLPLAAGLFAAGVASQLMRAKASRHKCSQWAIAGRWLAGLPVDGGKRPARDCLRRTGVRTGTIAALVLLGAGYMVARSLTEAVAAAAAAAVLGLLGWRAGKWLRALPWELTYTRPLAVAAAPMLGQRPAVTVSRERVVLHSEREDKRDRREWVVTGVKMTLPETFTGGKGKPELTRVVSVKTGLENPVPDWSHLKGPRPFVEWKPSKPPPALAPLEGPIRDAIDRATAREIIMGLAKDGKPLKVGIETDSPHTCLSMASGDGKSVTARNMLAQMLYHGGVALILDYKLFSHMWARNLPNVGYAGAIAEIHTACIWLDEEITRRNEVALVTADIEGHVHGNVGPPLWVVAEELNDTQVALQRYWKNVLEGRGDSPAAEALDRVKNVGRQVDVFGIFIAQRMSVKASGSGDARTSLGVRVFKDPDKETWEMLGFGHARPPSSGHIGRLQVVTRHEVREVQGTWMTGQQAHDLALAGTVGVPHPDMPFTGRLGSAAAAAGRLEAARTEGVVLARTSPALPAPHPPSEQAFDIGRPSRPPGAVSLRELVDAGAFRTIDAARQAVKRDRAPASGERPAGRFPRPLPERDGQALLYDAAEVGRYLEEKRRVGAEEAVA